MASGESVIGIDLGTTYSCVGVWHNEKVEIIANNQGNRITPSWVSFSDSERLLGESAKNGAPFNLTNSIYDAKRLIGRRFSDETVQSDMKKWPFQVVKGPNDKPMIAVKETGLNMEFSPEEISSMVLEEMKKVAEVYLGHKVSGAVVTVPAYFNETQRRATLEAGAKAGLNVLKIMDEPTAGAVAYGFKEQQEERLKNIFVFDLGGGTCDVSWLTVTGRSYVVRATAGNTHLGGEDFDNRMVDHFVDEFRRKHGTDIASDARAIEKLKKACEIAKRRLASDTVAKVQVECLYQGIDFSSEIKRARFDDLNKDYFLKCMDLVDQCVKRAEIGKQSIDKVVLVGGSTRILKIQEMLKDYFVGKQLYRDINPDEAVAFGATVQAAILSRCGAKSWEIVDRTPLSLGIDIVGDIMTIVIPRDTPIPFSKKKGFVTSCDNQKVVDFPVYQGESAKASDNHFLGRFELTGIRPAPKGDEKFDVWFDMDANGILNVSATNLSSGRKNNISITRGQLGI